MRTHSWRRLTAATALTLLATSCGGSNTADTSDAASADTTTTAPDITTSTPDTSDAASADTTTTAPDITTSTPDTGAGGHHGSAGEPTRFDADLADAAERIAVEVVGGAPVGGHQRVEVSLGSVVALMFTADSAEEIHVHGYDILRAFSPGHPAHFAFTAEIPGVFEVELEGSGRLLLLLEIS